MAKIKGTAFIPHQEIVENAMERLARSYGGSFPYRVEPMLLEAFDVYQLARIELLMSLHMNEINKVLNKTNYGNSKRASKKN